MKIHLMRPHTELNMCGRPRVAGFTTPAPEEVTCTSCIRLWTGNERWFANAIKEEWL